ncbi:hypothetical protein [Anaerovorax odorimutans]|uniref:hypothetical protein n=1 Tax=Anaerovorax odorimutans TaxID=109327 RepID=UPI000403B944|nr:hypothetical protein [Anaerovorax odorimutans]
MNAYKLTFLITVIAIAVSKHLSKEQVFLLSSITRQMSDTLITISKNEFIEKKF